MGSVLLPPSPNWYAAHLADVGPGAHAYCAHNSIVVLDSGGIQVCDVLRGHSNRTTAVAFVQNPESESLLIVSAAADKSVRLWLCIDAEHLKFSCRRALGKRPAEVKAIAAVSGAPIAVLGDAAGNLFVWELSSPPKKIQRLEGCKQNSGITSLACSPRPGDTVVAVGCTSGEVTFVDWKQGTVLSILRNHTVDVQCLRWAHIAIEDIGVLGESRPSSGGSDESEIERPSSTELLISAAPGACLWVYETRDVGKGACCGAVVGKITEGREIAIVSTLPLPKPPANLAQGQRQRLWLAADWVPAPAMRRHSKGIIDAWLVTSGYGGGLLARRVALTCRHSGSLSAIDELDDLDDDDARETPPVKLPGGHNRTVFSVLCSLDLSKEGPRMRIFTIGMDRAALTWSVPIPRLAKATYAALSASAAEEADKNAWQGAKVEAPFVGLGSFPHALAAFPSTLSSQHGDGIAAKLAVGCGDASIRIIPLRVSKDRPYSQNNPSVPITLDITWPESSVIWQGVPTAVTAVSWHPTETGIIAFGCQDGCIGLADCSKGTAVIAPSKHKAPIRNLAWFEVSDRKEKAELMAGREESDGTRDASTSINESEDRLTSEDYHLMTLSSDGALLRWKWWPSLALPGLFQEKQHKLSQRAIVRDALGRPRRMELPDVLTPSCVNSSVVLNCLLGAQDGTVVAISPGGYLQAIHPPPPTSASPITLMASEVFHFAALHADNLLCISPVDNARPGAATATLQEGSVATALALKRWYPDGAKEINSDGMSLLAAVGMQDGTIELWSHRGTGTLLVQEAILKGHGGPVLTVEWLKVQQTQFPIKRNEAHIGASGRLVLLSGAEDQSLRMWDVDAVLHEQKIRRRNSTMVEEECTEVEEVIGPSSDVVGSPALAASSALAVSLSPLSRVYDPGELSLNPPSLYDSTAVTGLARAFPAQVPVYTPGPSITERTDSPLVTVRKIPQTPFAAGYAPPSASTPTSVPIVVPVPILVGTNTASKATTTSPQKPDDVYPRESSLSVAAMPNIVQVPTPVFGSEASASLSSVASGCNGNSAAVGSKKIAKRGGSAAAVVPSLGAKGLLPPAPPRAETSQQQAALQASLLGVAMRVAGGTVPTSRTATKIGGNGVLSEEDYFSDLGCIVDPFSGMNSLHHASTALLEGPSQPPAAARVAAQRAAAVALWAGDVGTALHALVKHDALTADFVSFSAVAGRGAWEAASRAYAAVLEEKGEPHLAALHLLSVGDTTAACATYSRAGMVREAVTIASARLPPSHPTVKAARAAYAAQLEGRQEWERAAAQHVASQEWEKAVEALRCRRSVGSLQIAVELVETGRRSWDLDNDVSEHLLSVLTKDLAALGSALPPQGISNGVAAKAEKQNGLRRRYSGAELEAVRVQIEQNGVGDVAQTRMVNQLPPYMRPQK